MKKNEGYKENLQIATDLIHEIKVKDKIISSSDFLCGDLPCFNIDELQKYYTKFGKERVREYAEFLLYNNMLRTNERYLQATQGYRIKK